MKRGNSDRLEPFEGKTQKEITKMPKNNSVFITKSKAISKSTARKPLRNISNGVIASSDSTMKKPSQKYKEENEEKPPQVGNEIAALDRVLLVHSDISSLIHQIDELVVQALQFTSKKGMKEIQSFANVLSEMLTSLKPWVPRFQKVLSAEPVNQLEQSVVSGEVAYMKKDISHVVESPEQTKWDSLVSPSPLVSWRAGCTTEGGRQLFLLTPLPRPKAFSVKYQKPSKSVLEKTISGTMDQPPTISDVVGETNDDSLEGIILKPTPSKASDRILECKRVSPENLRRDGSVLVMTPYMKVSPPKTCGLLEPDSEFWQKSSSCVYQSTPFPGGVQNSDGSQYSESSMCQSLEKMSLNYPEFLGIKLGNNYGNRRKVVEESPNWLMSPPKTCVLLEPPDDKLSNSTSDYPFQEVGSSFYRGANLLSPPKTCVLLEPSDDKLLTNASSDCTFQEFGCSFYNGANLLSLKENDLQGGQSLTNKTCKRGVDSSVKRVECTPMMREPESTIRLGKRPGENTLKKELWTRFEAASLDGIHFKVSILDKGGQKGFLDRLDEVS